MNKLSGVIKNIKTVEAISHIHVEVGDKIFSILLLDDVDTYALGEKVILIFKETEVMIATNDSTVSARNAFLSPITSIVVGDILAEIHFDFYDTEISSVITKGALLEMKCKVGDTFKWFVKSNEVSIQKI